MVRIPISATFFYLLYMTQSKTFVIKYFSLYILIHLGASVVDTVFNDIIFLQHKTSRVHLAVLFDQI